MTALARSATFDDVPEMVRLRAVLFESLGVDAGGPVWRDHCASVLTEGLTAGWLVGAVVGHPAGRGLVAVGTAEVQQRLPAPRNPSGRMGYISTMVTDPAHRRQGHGRAVLACLLDALAARDLSVIELHATPDGEALYRDTGFVDRPGGIEMRLVP